MAIETISSWLSMAGSLRNRLSELKSMKSSISTRTRYYSEPEKVEEPTYDIKKVDAMCINIESALFRIDRAIKQSNSSTKIDLPNVSYEELMKPIE